MAIATVSSKGQVVIPKEIREALHIKQKQRVLLKLANDHLEIIPLPENPVEAFCGIFEKGSSLVDALLKARKEEVEREEKEIARFLQPSRLSKKRR